MDRQTCKIQNIYNCLFIFRYNCNRCIPLFYFQMVRVKCKMVQCIYWAFNKCVPGVLTMKELNNQIESHYIEMRRLNPNHKKGWSGIKNQTWHQACISKALSQKYGKGSYIWKKIRFKNLYHFLKSNKTGRFYIHGLFNYRLFADTSSANSAKSVVDLTSAVDFRQKVGKKFSEKSIIKKCDEHRAKSRSESEMVGNSARGASHFF